MITDERVMTIFVEANPAPNVDDLHLIEIGSAAYLATLEQRSSEVTRLDRKPAEKHEKKQTPRTWLAAAVVVAVVGVALLVATQGGEETPVVTEPVPTTVAEATPTTNAEVPPTSEVPPTTVNPAEAEWQSIPVWEGEVFATSVRRTDMFGVPFSFTAPPGFQNDLGEIREETDISLELSLISIRLEGSGSVNKTVDTIMSQDRLTFTEPSETVIGGAPGVVFDASNTSDSVVTVWYRPDNTAQLVVQPGELSRFYVVDVAGTTVTIHVLAPDTAFDNFVSRAEDILNSFTWRDLS